MCCFGGCIRGYGVWWFRRYLLVSIILISPGLHGSRTSKPGYLNSRTDLKPWLYSRSILHDLRSRKIHPLKRLNDLSTPRKKQTPLHPQPPPTHNPQHRLLLRRNSRLPNAHPRRSDQTKRAGRRIQAPALTFRNKKNGPQRNDPSYSQVPREALEIVEWVYGAGGTESAVYGDELSHV